MSPPPPDCGPPGLSTVAVFGPQDKPCMESNPTIQTNPAIQTNPETIPANHYTRHLAPDPQ